MDNDSIIAISMDDDTVIKDGKDITPAKNKIANKANNHKKIENIFIFGHSEGDLSKLKVICNHLIKLTNCFLSVCHLADCICRSTLFCPLLKNKNDPLMWKVSLRIYLL